jgi:hypothetical protein
MIFVNKDKATYNQLLEEIDLIDPQDKSHH